MEQRNKKYVVLATTVSLFFGLGLQAYTDENANENYTYTESEARSKIKDNLRKKFCDTGVFWDGYDDTQSEIDAKKLYTLVQKKCIKNASNFKRIPITKYVKKWHKSRTTASSEIALEGAIKELIIKRISEINPDFSCKAQEITFNILKALRNGNEKEFIGKKLERKIKKEISRIRAKQTSIERNARANNRARSGIKKYFTTDDCPICMESFSDRGERIYLNPCGHNICVVCFARYNEKCSLCRKKVKNTEKQHVQPDHNPEYDRG